MAVVDYPFRILFIITKVNTFIRYFFLFNPISSCSCSEHPVHGRVFSENVGCNKSTDDDDNKQSRKHTQESFVNILIFCIWK